MRMEARIAHRCAIGIFFAKSPQKIRVIPLPTEIAIPHERRLITPPIRARQKNGLDRAKLMRRNRNNPSLRLYPLKRFPERSLGKMLFTANKNKVVFPGK